MDWTCKKCGKTLEVSDEQLHETQGVVICPQCLASELIPGYKRKTASSTASPPPRVATTQAQRTTTQKNSPPPYRKKINFVEDTSNRPTTRSTSTPTTARPKKRKSKKKKNRSPLAPHTGWGCLWRSVIYTLILLAAATIAGFILDYI